MPTRKKLATTSTRAASAAMTRRLAALADMSVGELAAEYREVFGEPTRSRNKGYLRKKVAWRVQELAEGGLSERARSRIEELNADAPAQWRGRGQRRKAASRSVDPARDPRLPDPGIVLTREYQGVDHEVTVLDEGFEYQGERYRSLSKVAREITDTNWNGFLFFGLQRRTQTGNVTRSA